MHIISLISLRMGYAYIYIYIPSPFNSKQHRYDWWVVDWWTNVILLWKSAPPQHTIDNTFMFNFRLSAHFIFVRFLLCRICLVFCCVWPSHTHTQKFFELLTFEQNHSLFCSSSQQLLSSSSSSSPITTMGYSLVSTDKQLQPHVDMVCLTHGHTDMKK